MKFESRSFKRRVTETMAALLLPLKPFVTEKTWTCISTTLYILEQTEVEDGNDDR
jgi:valyl-tRNA synthetase